MNMGYITNTDIQTRLGNSTYVQLADDNGDGTADAAIVDEARLAAEGEVNGYLARRYPVPIDVVEHSELATVLKSVTLDLAEYRLRTRRPPVPGDVIRRRQETAEWLKGVAEGRIALPSASQIGSNTAMGIVASSHGAERLLSREKLESH